MTEIHIKDLVVNVEFGGNTTEMSMSVISSRPFGQEEVERLRRELRLVIEVGQPWKKFEELAEAIYNAANGFDSSINVQRSGTPLVVTIKDKFHKHCN